MSVKTLTALRADYHKTVCAQILGLRSKKDKRGTRVFNIADGSSAASVDLAEALVSYLGYPTCAKPPGPQTAGNLFTEHTMKFLSETFARIAHLLPGAWFLEMKPALAVIAKFDQYEHLDEIQKLVKENQELAATLGRDYLVTPDIVVGRTPLSDADINRKGSFIGKSTNVARHTPFRKLNARRPILHASVSCKWTMRSDRAQNTRTEALNLVRNRKGKTPHIAAVTFEPLPSRLESIAMGTGDIDCTYHAALHELEKAADTVGDKEVIATLATLVSSRRLRDISDLPFDLAA